MIDGIRIRLSLANSVTLKGVEVVKTSLDLTGKYPNTNKRRIGFLDECN